MRLTEWLRGLRINGSARRRRASRTLVPSPAELLESRALLAGGSGSTPVAAIARAHRGCAGLAIGELARKVLLDGDDAAEPRVPRSIGDSKPAGRDDVVDDITCIIVYLE